MEPAVDSPAQGDEEGQFPWLEDIAREAWGEVPPVVESKGKVGPNVGGTPEIQAVLQRMEQLEQNNQRLMAALAAQSGNQQQNQQDPRAQIYNQAINDLVSKGYDANDALVQNYARSQVENYETKNQVRTIDGRMNDYFQSQEQQRVQAQLDQEYNGALSGFQGIVSSEPLKAVTNVMVQYARQNGVKNFSHKDAITELRNAFVPSSPEAAYEQMKGAGLMSAVMKLANKDYNRVAKRKVPVAEVNQNNNGKVKEEPLAGQSFVDRQEALKKKWFNFK